MLHKRRRWEEVVEDDPAASLLNLFDVWIAFAAALLLAMASYYNSGSKELARQLEQLREKGVKSIGHTLVVLFDNDIFFANAGVFRRELHQLMVKYPHTKHLVIDAVAISDIDFTGMTILSQVISDLTKDGVSIVLARADDKVRRSFHTSFDKVIRDVKFHDSVDTAVNAGRGHGSASS